MTSPTRSSRAPTDFEFMRLLLANAAAHFKLALGLRSTFAFPDDSPRVSYLEAFSFGQHIASYDDLALTQKQEGHAFAALEHCATYIAVVQVHTVLEAIHPAPFRIEEPEIAEAFQIARLTRNAFAHNPFAPTWDIRPAWKNRTFSVPGIISLNTSGLDGKLLRRKHYGGPLAILRFIEYADSIVQLRVKQQKKRPSTKVLGAEAR